MGLQSSDVVSDCLIVFCLRVKGATVDGPRIGNLTTSSSDHLTVCPIVSHLNEVRHVGVVDVHQNLIGLKCHGAGIFKCGFVHVSTIQDQGWNSTARVTVRQSSSRGSSFSMSSCMSRGMASRSSISMERMDGMSSVTSPMSKISPIMSSISSHIGFSLN